MLSSQNMNVFLRTPITQTQQVIVLHGAPGSYLIAKQHKHLKAYLQWSEAIRSRGEAFIKQYLKRPFLVAHLRNGSDWQQACEHAVGKQNYMSSAECGFVKSTSQNQAKTITNDKKLCLQGEQQVLSEIKQWFGQDETFFFGIYWYGLSVLH